VVKVIDERPHRTPRDHEFTRSARAIMPAQRNRRTSLFAAVRGDKSTGMTFPSKLPLSIGGSGPHLIHGSLGPPES